MPKFSQKSMDKLKTAHPELQRLFLAVIIHYDCTIVYGVRDMATQNRLFAEKKSKLAWPESKHNITNPADFSLAVDVVPFEQTAVDYDVAQCRYFGGFVMGMAAAMGINLRWGGDWDQDNDVNDQAFNDLTHFELVGFQ